MNSQASFKKLKESGSLDALREHSNDKTEEPLNPITLNNLNDFYTQHSSDKEGNEQIFNLTNFYMNHGKYFSGNNIYNGVNNISNI